MSGSADAPRLRAYQPADFDALVRVWHETKQVAYPYLPLEQDRSLEEDAAFLAARILPRCALVLGQLGDELSGFLALDGSYVDRLYVHPRHQRLGVGTLLLRWAQQRSPRGLELHTHQKNVSARAFYEKHGFRAVRYGVSPAPESEPDVEYHWRPREVVTAG